MSVVAMCWHFNFMFHHTSLAHDASQGVRNCVEDMNDAEWNPKYGLWGGLPDSIGSYWF